MASPPSTLDPGLSANQSSRPSRGRGGTQGRGRTDLEACPCHNQPPPTSPCHGCPPHHLPLLGHHHHLLNLESGKGTLFVGQIQNIREEYPLLIEILTCRTSSGATTPFKECMDGSRATVVPADRGSCVVPRDCQVASWTSWSPAFPQPCAAGASFVITLLWQAFNINNLFRLAMQSDISSHFPSSASVLPTLNI